MLKPNEIKPFLFHTEGVVREFAVNYFAKSFSLDSELLPLILAYTRTEDEKAQIHPDDEDANQLMLVNARYFIQTQETFVEILERIERADQNKSSYVQLLLNAGPRLLEKNLSELLRYPELMKGAEQAVELLQLSTLDLWKKLMEYAETHVEDYVGEFDFNYGKIIVRELATRLDLPFEEMRRILLSKSEEDGGYKEVYLTILAGELRDEAWIPILIDKLSLNGDLICQTASDALAKIGTPAVVEALFERYRLKKGYFSIFAAPLLGQIKVEEAEDAILKLLFVEDDKEDATVLVDSLGQLLSARGIPLIQQYIEEGYSSCIINLEKTYYCNALINGVELPDMVEYRQMIQEERDNYRKHLDEVQGRSNSLSTAKPVDKPDKIGRNDPCPCGSGNKYKKCCGK
ncbi:MAG: SEC-C metal-binding domain-containing protein [Desulfitobacteriaceae bacterium]